jgi:hypothetical protein
MSRVAPPTDLEAAPASLAISLADPDAATTANPATQSRLPPLRARRDGWTADRQAAFLTAIGNGECVMTAALAVGMSREGAYRLRRNPRAAGFAANWAAIEAARAALPTLAELLADPDWIVEAELASDRWIEARAARPDFDRFLIRRLTSFVGTCREHAVRYSALSAKRPAKV